LPDFTPSFIETFLPLFVAVNIPGILPIYIGMTEGLASKQRRRLLIGALSAALVLAVVMLFAGDIIFRTLGITLYDLRVGGGLILLTISVTDLAFGDMKKRRSGEDEGEEQVLGAVPLGIPLIIGPAAITSILVSARQYGYPPTLAAIVVNMTLVFVTFTYGPAILRFFGPATSKALAKVASLFLAAIAVAMIRAGVTGMLQQ
jgi:multiple antibiotic resistance protein